jgi:hypothetical protein
MRPPVEKWFGKAHHNHLCFFRFLNSINIFYSKAKTISRGREEDKVTCKKYPLDKKFPIVRLGRGFPARYLLFQDVKKTGGGFR